MGRYGAWLAALAAVAVLLSGCESFWHMRYSGRWISPLHQDHPLVGRIWVPAQKRFATAGEIYASLQHADFVLVGEKHDNADHHRYQSVLLREMIALGRRPAIVFEMLTATQQPSLDAYLTSHPADSAGIGKAVGWEARGWPRWRIYRPIAEVALGNGAPLVAGGLDREVTRAVSAEGATALGADRARALRLDEPVGDAMRAAMRKEIDTSHCGQLPAAMLDPMVAVTLAKDATMAAAMNDGRALPGRDSALLIAGAGHARADWGVPWHLRKLAPDARIVSVGLLEVAAGETEPEAYAASFGGTLPFDFVWFAPRVDDNDPCEAFAEQLRHLRDKGMPSPDAGGD